MAGTVTDQCSNSLLGYSNLVERWSALWREHCYRSVLEFASGLFQSGGTVGH